jgi:hypothetical protein
MEGVVLQIALWSDAIAVLQEETRLLIQLRQTPQ